jgi:hypothetical protein
MSCEHLVCASCAGPVVEGRCEVCRAARASVHHHGLPIGTQMIIVLIGLLMLLAALTALRA